MTVKKILCVDDSNTDLAQMQEICKNAGFAVVTATSGDEAIKKAASEMPDVILMDIMMKPVNGFQACRKIVKQAVTKDIPVIVVSSKSEPADKMWATEQGAKGYITKPYAPEELLSELAKF